MVDGEFDVAKVENSCNKLACLGNVSLGQPNGLESELELLRGKEENPVWLDEGRMEGEGAHACCGSARQGWKGKRREPMCAVVQLDEGRKREREEPMHATVQLDKGRRRGGEEPMCVAVRLDKGMKGGGGEPMRAAVWLDEGRKRGVHSC